MKLKKIAALLTAAVMSVGVMASCGGSKSDDKSKTDTKSAAETSGAEGDSSESEEIPVSQTHTNDPMTVTSAKDLVAKMSSPPAVRATNLWIPSVMLTTTSASSPLYI